MQIRTLIPYSIVATPEQQNRLVQLGRTWLSSDAPPSSFVADLLTGTAPRLRGRAPGETIQPESIDGKSIADVIALLDASYLVIQGPPGTGKTTKGAAAICELLERGFRIGITSRSHAAIDNMTAAVDREAQRRGLVFQGLRKPAKDVELPAYLLASSNLRVQKDSMRPDKVYTPELQLYAATAWGFVSKNVPNGYFDLVFVDEAGQFALADALALHAAAKNIVFLGDPLQLKQVSRGKHPLGANASVLEHALGNSVTIPPDRGIFLDTSYRMHPAICKFISQNVYGGRLQAAGTSLQRIDSSNFQGSGLRFVPIVHSGNSRESKEEAEWILQTLRTLLTGTVTDRDGVVSRLRQSDVIIVTPYNAQRTRLERALHASDMGGIAVGTVDKFQGQEAAVVIYSMATSSGEDLPRDIDFLFQTNRFNVAISRAKAMCILVASPALLRTSCATIEEIEMVNLLCRYVEEASSY